MTTTDSILTEAERLVTTDRQETYGPPHEDFAKTAEFWSTLLSARNGRRVTVTNQDVALMMVLLKVSRELHTPTRDNLVDAAGYLATLQMIYDATVDQ